MCCHNPIFLNLDAGYGKDLVVKADIRVEALANAEYADIPSGSIRISASWCCTLVQWIIDI